MRSFVSPPSWLSPASHPIPKMSLVPRLASLLTVVSTLILPMSAQIVGTYLPHGPASPSTSAWNPSAYRDIPWWFSDSNGASDAYDVSAIYAARLNKNNSGGYEAGIINTPNFGTNNPYGSAGGAFGTSADVTWGNGNTWNFAMTYAWNNGAPVSTLTFERGGTTRTATANLGSRVIDFVEGNVARPTTAGGAANPYREPHQLSDVLLRFATIDTHGVAPAFTRDSVKVENMYASINGGASQALLYNDGSGNLKSSLENVWVHEPGGDANSNPREVELLLFNDLLPDHQSSLNLTGQLTFAWNSTDGTASSISGSGLMFEAKLGDMNFYSGAEPFAVKPIPEPSALLLGLAGVLLLLRRRH